MFGSLRLLLALLVVISHLVGKKYFVHFGFYAVRGFFILSGYLMTAALQDVYKFDLRKFWANRFLRLLPPYYLVCLLTLVVVLAAPASAAAFIRQWQVDMLWHDALTNLVILPLHHVEPHFRLIPVYWSVAVELEMYVLLFFVAARSERLALVTFAVGAIYHAFCIYEGLGFDARYFFPPSAVLSFSLGALIYFALKRGLVAVSPTVAMAALAAWLINMAAAGLVLPIGWEIGPGYYVGTGLFVVVVVGLANTDRFTQTTRSIDRTLGELAYPTFLLQFLAGYITAMAFMPGSWRGWPLTLMTLPVLLAMAVGLAMLNRRFVDPLRDRMRNSAPAQETAPAVAA